LTTVISVEHLTKRYELGVISTGTLTRDMERWWVRVPKLTGSLAVWYPC